MRRRVAFGVLLSAGLVGCVAAPSSSERRSTSLDRGSATLAGSMPTIVVDAGHGGRDPGTSHYGLQEKQLVLDIARRVRTMLEAQGFRVVLTRDADRFIPLSERVAIANRLDADLFVSVHVNANRNRKVSGAEVYYPRESTIASTTTRWPPSVGPAEIGIASFIVRHALWDLVLRRSRSNAGRLASTICGTLENGLQVHCKRKSARFVVLREAAMPAVLVEVGYVSNRTEAAQLGRQAYRQAAAQAIASGVVRYLGGRNAPHL